MKIIKAFNINTQKEEKASIKVDHNNEFVVTFEDGSFIKMPSDYTAADIKEELISYQNINNGQVTAAEVEETKTKNEEVLEEL